MPAYLTKDQFRLLTTMPGSYVDEIEAAAPGYVDARLTVWSAQIDGRLAKRYGTPFTLPAPVIVQEWLTCIVTVDVWLRRGVSGTDQQYTTYSDQRTQALTEIKEAADSDTGLYDLPLLASGVGGSAISLGGPRSYSEASPYVWADQQACIGRTEDDTGEGTIR
jgi:hypothetical protein